MNDIIKLSPRLLTAASYVKEGARVLDVGTDHAFVPIYLLQKGRASFAAGSDINPGPLKTAKDNAVKFGLENKLKLYLSDGLSLCECDENKYDHIIICGMGGELISSIIASSPYSFRSGLRFILQPMTMPDKLRLFLSQNGFTVTDETIIKDGGKYYQFVVCEYFARPYTLSPTEMLLGRVNIEKRKNNSTFYEYAGSLIRIYRQKICGMKLGGENTETEGRIYSDLLELYKESGSDL